MDAKELLEAAMREAYASAPHDVVVLHTLEINHHTFLEPIRAVRWPIAGEAPEEFILRLEDDAPFDPGKAVKFLGLPFKIVTPDKDTDSIGQFKLSIDNVEDRIDEYLANAALGGGKISAIYREYIKGEELEGPASVWQGMTFTSPRMEGQTITMDGVVLDWLTRGWSKLYTPGDYPALVTSR